MCVLQTGLERVVRMGLTIGLIVWVFQSQAQMDRRVYRNYIDIRKYAFTSHVFDSVVDSCAFDMPHSMPHSMQLCTQLRFCGSHIALACAYKHAYCTGQRTCVCTLVLIPCSARHACVCSSVCGKNERTERYMLTIMITLITGCCVCVYLPTCHRCRC